jgi:hypothetical protein
MTRKDKLLQKIKNNPRSASFGDVRQLLMDVGFAERQPKSGSSHHIYYHTALEQVADGQADSGAGGAPGCALSGLSATGESRGAEAVCCVLDFVGMNECNRGWPISSLPSLAAEIGQGQQSESSGK